MSNRLAQAQSPYLRQHADNPVDWWEWGPEAFALARRLDRPIFLSVGYAACHWCHVMAHESFEDQSVATALEAGFVAVKVDREERPDIDAIYMAATTALTGRGGWPMTVLLTPTGEPFWCGTYLPRDTLLDLLRVAADAWAGRRDEVDAATTRLIAAVTASVSPLPPTPIVARTLDAAVVRLGAGFDRRHGGFGGAPKFPPSMVLEFLLRHHGRTGSATALEMASATFEAMARGGMYDQIGGGFHRYAVDAGWVVPHFEKMLYDNALLARAYVHWWRATGIPLGRAVAEQTCAAILRDFRTEEGAFAAALDADTQGVEGLTYAWSPAQLVEVLGESDGRRAAAELSVTAEGTFEHGLSTLQRRSDPATDADQRWWDDVRARLLAARDRRPQPFRDAKVIASWNGLAIAALADIGALLDRTDLIDAAAAAARYLLDRHWVDDQLRRVSLGGVVGSAAGLADDYGNLAEGLLALHQATGAGEWLAEAGGLLDVAVERFGDDTGVFYDTAADTDLLVRPHSPSDNAEPAGHSALAGALLGYAVLAGSEVHLARADAALAAGGTVAASEPRFAGWLLAVAEARQAGPLQVAIVGSGPAATALTHAARSATSPGVVVVTGPPDAPGVPLLAGRATVGGQGTAYVCRGAVCSLPITTVPALLTALADDGATPASAGGQP